MPKPTNENIGKIQCNVCQGEADVRRDKGGKLYYFCPECGIDNRQGAGFRKYMEENAVLFETTGPGVDPDPTPEPSATVDPEPDPEPVKESAFSKWWNA